MTTQEAERQYAVIAISAKDWARGLHTIDSQMELYMIGQQYGVELPLYARHFRSSNSPDHVKATGAHRGLLRTLGKLKTAIIKKEGPLV